MRKRLLCTLLVCCMLAALFPSHISARVRYGDWPEWGPWSEWGRNVPASSTDTLDVETESRTVEDVAAHTEYRYGRWVGATVNWCKEYGESLHGGTYSVEETAWSTVRATDTDTHWLCGHFDWEHPSHIHASGTDHRGYPMWTKYKVDGYSNPDFFWEESRWVDAVSHTEYRYRSRTRQVYYDYTVYFDANGGSVSPTQKDVTNGERYGDLPTPARTYYDFLGWFTARDGGTSAPGYFTRGTGRTDTDTDTDTETPHMEIENRLYDDNTGLFSCDLKLSGADMTGQIFAVLFAEAGQMKRVTTCSAAGSLHIDLPGTATTDYIHVLWTDSRYAPVVEPTVLRMRDNGKAAYEKFEEEMRKLEPEDLVPGRQPTRLLVSSSEALPWRVYGAEKAIAGPNNFYVLVFSNYADTKAAKETLEKLSCVRYAEYDDVIESDTDEYSGAELLGEGVQIPPTPLSWGFAETGIGEYAASLKEKGLDREIIVAVVDSGVDYGHEFLEGRFADNGYDFVGNDDRPQDEFGHGTHVTGTVVDCTPGMNVKILEVRVLNEFGRTTIDYLRRGIVYAVNHGANVINLSLGNKVHMPPIDDAIQYAISKNVTVVVAAGNDNTDAAECCPAHIEDCITVAAIKKDNDKLSRCEFSNYGKPVDIAAPGEKINSCIPKYLSHKFESKFYHEMSGTSQAAPHVSAAAALLMCEHGTGQTPYQIEQTLKDTASALPEDTTDGSWTIYKRDNPGATWTDFLGAGVLNMRPVANDETPDVDVTFDGNGGTPATTKATVKQGETVSRPDTNPTRDGYTFTGWFTDRDGLTAFDFTTKIQASTTIYAGWEQNPVEQCVVTFDVNGGAPSIDPVTVDKGASVAEPDTNPTRDGYTFTGWFTEKNGSTAFDFTTKIQASTTIYAGWIQSTSTPVSEAYALLYADGEFVFQKTDTPDPAKTLLATYPVAVADEGGAQYARWYDRRADIKTVTFADTLRPRSTATWFSGCANLSEVRKLENLDTSQTTDMSQMFARCGLTTLDLSMLDTRNVVNMRQMFNNCGSLETLDLSGWNTANVTDMADMFNGCSALKKVYASDSFTTDKVSNSAGMFSNCTALPNYDSAHTDKEYARIVSGTSAPGYFTDKNAPTPTPSVGVYAILYSDGTLTFQHGDTPESGKSVQKTYKVDLNAVYAGPSVWNPSYAPWYSERKTIRVVDFADKISPTATAWWFYECNNLERVDNIRNLDTASVTNMNGMFCDCGALTALDASRFDTAKVTNMNCMFSGCGALTALDVSHFDTANVKYMDSMFSDCKSLTTLDVSRFDTANVKYMSYMFSGCSGLTELDISSFDTAKVQDITEMFSGCFSLKTIYASDKFTTASANQEKEMFFACTSLVGGNGTMYDNTRRNKAYARIDGGVYNPGYFTRKS